MANVTDVQAVSDGDRLYQGYFNDIAIHRKHLEVLPGSSTASTSYVDLTNASFTISGSNSLLFGVGFGADMTGATCNIQFLVYGATLGSKILSQEYAYTNPAGTSQNKDFVWCSNTGSSTLYSAESAARMACGTFAPLKLPDATTTVKYRIKATTGTVTVGSLISDVMYVGGFIEDA